MRVFIDTNVWLESLCGRAKAIYVRELFDKIEDGGHEAFLSSSSLCTIAYYVEMNLKDQGIHKPEKTAKTREILNKILDLAIISELSHNEALTAINDPDFSDFEDGIQYQCALHANCEVLFTFNVKDFKNADKTKIQIISPDSSLKLLQNKT